MASQKESVEKYTRYFVQKSLQAIVQSRMGEKIKNTVKENSTMEWFSIPVVEVPELKDQVRRLLGAGPVLAQPVNVEISLKTRDNNAYLFLEVWSISLDVTKKDLDHKGSSTFYGRFATALKSIISVSRLAPAYNLSQRQKKDDFQIHFQLNVGPPNLNLLLDNIQTRQIGRVATSMGTILVTVSYTNRLHMPQQPRVVHAQPLSAKADHFGKPHRLGLGVGVGGQFSEPKPCNRKFRNPTSVEDLRNLESQEKVDAFSSIFSTSPPEGSVYSTSPPPPSLPPSLPQIQEASSLIDSVDGAHNEIDAEGNAYPVSPFFDGSRPEPENPEDVPFAGLMAGLPPPPPDSSVDDSVSDDEDGGKRGGEGEEEECDVCRGTESEEEEEEEEEEEQPKDSASDESFVMLPPLESPFRNSEPSTGDLGEFYHQMLLAPMAQLSFNEPHTVSATQFFVSVKEELDHYSALQPGIERFITSLGGEEEEEELSG